MEKPPVDTSAITPTSEERGRFQLSREMKILLGVLALGAAVGGWYVFSGAGTPAVDTAVTPPAASGTSGAVTPGTPGTGSTGGTTTGTAGTPAPTPPGTTVVPGVTPGTGSVTPPAATTGTGVSTAQSGAGGVDVAEVPFLNPEGSASGTTGSGTADGAPAGINPADPLAAVPTSNPFQPLKVTEAVGQTAGVPSSTPTQSSTPTPVASTPVPSSTPSLSSAGAVPLPNVPLAGVNSGGVSLSGGSSALPGSTGSGLGNGGAIPLPNVSPTGLPTSGGTATGSGTTGSGTTGTGAAATLTPPPAAGTITPGLTTPALSSIPLGGTLAGSTSTTAGGTTAGGNATGSAANAGGAAVVPAGQPSVITQYGSANAPVTAPVSALDTLVQSRSLVFNAVVLGPVNTAIFKTDKGFVVVTTGQTLPDSNVTLKEVTATSATLSLGNDSKILELDKR
ncbi:hypothetical protein [Deinococcus aquiradiocola]|nr:hypothetical protein [Deinococcus aquiradiocola]